MYEKIMGPVKLDYEKNLHNKCTGHVSLILLNL